MAGGSGYFLAGRTLKPIKDMVDEQNQFISDASHELRTPIATLRAEMEGKLLEKNISNTDARNLINSNLEELERLQKLSDGLLKLTRVPNNHIRYHERVEVFKITEKAIKKTAALAKKKKITIKNNITSLEIWGQEDSLIDLLVILLDNAIKYSPNSSIIEISAKKEGQSVIIAVTDQGMGISQTDLPHVFERFYRADKSRSQAPGYGLGLAIAQKIAQMHMGNIKVKSQPDKGSTFEVVLPV